MTVTHIDRVETYSPHEWIEMVEDFDLHDVFSELFSGAPQDYENDPTDIDRNGGAVICDLIGAADDQYVLLPPQSESGTTLYTVGVVDSDDELETETPDIVPDDIDTRTPVGFAGTRHVDPPEALLMIETDYAGEVRHAVSALRNIAGMFEGIYQSMDHIPPKLDNDLTDLYLLADKLEVAENDAR